jgi:transcriptional regulator with XRE-family HTH domain
VANKRYYPHREIEVAGNDPMLNNLPVITGRQIKAARGLLGWSLKKLARETKLAFSTVQRADAAKGVPRIASQSMEAIERAFDAAGIVFLSAGDVRSGGEGVRFK